ncbi:hypothetical protein HK101_005935 [Irineochytrium annulatum]|nr:hypothetical protein HK101_005935 [Irineochytrium annulatum]
MSVACSPTTTLPPSPTPSHPSHSANTTVPPPTATTAVGIGELSDMLAHEIRNPLTGILGHLHLLKAGLGVRRLALEELERDCASRGFVLPVRPLEVLRKQLADDDESVAAIAVCADHAKLVADDVLLLAEPEPEPERDPCGFAEEEGDDEQSTIVDEAAPMEADVDDSEEDAARGAAGAAEGDGPQDGDCRVPLAKAYDAHVEVFNPADVIADVAHMLQSKAAAKGVQLVTDFPPRTPTTTAPSSPALTLSSSPTSFCGDPAKVKRVLVNLVSSTIYQADAGDTVRVAVERVRVDASGNTIVSDDDRPAASTPTATSRKRRRGHEALRFTVQDLPGDNTSSSAKQYHPHANYQQQCDRRQSYAAGPAHQARSSSPRRGLGVVINRRLVRSMGGSLTSMRGVREGGVAFTARSRGRIAGPPPAVKESRTGAVMRGVSEETTTALMAMEAEVDAMAVEEVTPVVKVPPSLQAKAMVPEGMLGVRCCLIVEDNIIK